MHVVFIEEPEAHLHPQMQEVFIRKLNEIVDEFVRTIGHGIEWPVQFVVTTHSSHIANEAPFVSMRYFLTEDADGLSGVCKTRIKDLSDGVFGTHQEFLHKYMTLTSCDLLFADKTILIEGATERILLPKFIEHADRELDEANKLASQYISVVEAGGAHAHKFFELLNFLELKTLLITDIDAVKLNAGNRYEACLVSEGVRTSNACIKAWFNASTISPAELIAKASTDKVTGIRCVAYQIPELESEPCGRSYEEAFILANQDLFELSGGSNEDIEKQAAKIAEGLKKTDFAIEYAIEKHDWIIPRYIRQGLFWLACGSHLPPVSEINAPGEASETEELIHA